MSRFVHVSLIQYLEFTIVPGVHGNYKCKHSFAYQTGIQHMSHPSYQIMIGKLQD